MTWGERIDRLVQKYNDEIYRRRQRGETEGLDILVEMANELDRGILKLLKDFEL